MSNDPSAPITFSAPIHPVTLLERPHVARLPNGHELVLPAGTTLREGEDARIQPSMLREITLKAFEGLLNDLPTDPGELRAAFLESLVAVERTIFPLLYVSYRTPFSSGDNVVLCDTGPLDKPAFDAISARFQTVTANVSNSRQKRAE